MNADVLDSNKECYYDYINEAIGTDLTIASVSIAQPKMLDANWFVVLYGQTYSGSALYL